MRKGRSLERLVTVLETVLCGNEHTTIKSPLKLRDALTDQLREHDVALITKTGHHEIITAIECRDRSRPIGVDAVEQFAKKCEHTRVNHAVMVSAAGFRNTARKKAAALGIDCLDLDTAAQFNWIAAGSFQSYRICSSKFRVVAMADPLYDDKPEKIIVRDELGEILEHGTLDKYLQQCLSNILQPPFLAAGDHEIIFRVNTPGFTIENGNNGEVRPLQYLRVEATYQVELSSSPVTNTSYTRQATGETLGDAAITHIDVAGRSASLVFHKEPDSSISVRLVFNGEPPTKKSRGESLFAVKKNWPSDLGH